MYDVYEISDVLVLKAYGGSGDHHDLGSRF